MADPSDGYELQQYVAAHAKVRVVGILGKTEGNGCVNDFSRGLASMTVKSIVPKACVVMSGGTEGVLTPHYTVLGVSDEPDDNRGEGALAIGVASSRELLPEEVGTQAQVEATRDAVAEASIGLTSLKWAQVKCPLVSPEDAAAAASRGHKVVSENAYESMAMSRIASAKGVAEYTRESEWSAVASTSAGAELNRCQVVAIGHADTWSGPLRMVSGVMHDALDITSILEACERAGLDHFRGQLVEPHRVKAVFAKSDPSATVRGRRTTMFSDSDLNATRHSRAAVAGLLCATFADTRLFVSGGAEFQGPPGGGPFAIIYEA